jgi:hypothetical protein
MLDTMVSEFRSDGYDRTDLELWSVSFPGTAASVTTYAGSSTESCFEASTDFLFEEAYSYDKDDLWLVDRGGYAVFWGNFNDSPLDDPANYDAVATAVENRL